MAAKQQHAEMPGNAILKALSASRSALQSAWLLYIDLPLAVASDLLLSRQQRGGLASLQTCVAAYRTVMDLVQMLVALYVQVLTWIPLVGRSVGLLAASVLGPLAPAVKQQQQQHQQQRRRSRPSRIRYLTAPERVAIVLNDLSCSQAEMQALGRLIVWCLQEGAKQVTIFDPQGLIKAHRGWLIQEIAINSHGIYSAKQVKRDKLATVPHHRRPPMALKVRSTQALSFEGPQGFSVQLLSLQDTFASVSRLADGSSRPSSPISQGSIGSSSSGSSSSPDPFNTITDPQAMLVYGACFTPGGYPPWTLQYAEMYHMGHLHKTNRMQVRHQFEKYAGTTHRNGS